MDYVTDNASTAGSIQTLNKTAGTNILHMISPLPNLHPERTGATLARIKEVLEITLVEKTHAGIIFMECEKAAGKGISHFDSMNLDQGAAVAAILEDLLSPEELAKITELIMHSEISTDEVIALHQKYKIPVSHLEDDLLPVKGREHISDIIGSGAHLLHTVGPLPVLSAPAVVFARIRFWQQDSTIVTEPADTDERPPRGGFHVPDPGS